jgi:ABC-2 type transport system permease protein
MLWYKTWRETRVRLLMSGLAIGWIVAVIILFQGGSRRADGAVMPYTSYIWNAIYKDYVRNLFIVLTIVLGGGTLVQERALGTAGFTLALPVTRSRLFVMRACIGLGEIVLLALLPAVVIPALSAMTGEHYPIEQALGFAVLWAAGGALTFSMAQLVSALVANEYVAWVGGFLLILLYEAVVKLTALDRIATLDVFGTMSGNSATYFNVVDHVLVGPLPWLSLLAWLAFAAAGLLAADRVLRRRDF